MSREPAWLTAAVDQRLALMFESLDSGELLSPGTVVFTPLTEPREGASKAEMERWDHSCDNCKRHVPTAMRSGTVQRMHRGNQVLIGFGACPECLELP